MSLTTSLSAATQSLFAQELELQVTNNNIANVDTAGYTREVVNLSEADPTQNGNLSIGNGVDIQGIQSVQDELLTGRIQQQTSQKSSADAQVSALDEIQTLFPSTGSSLSTGLSSFFTSLTALSTDPANTADRQTALSSAQTLVQQFNSVASGLSAAGSTLDTTVGTDVAQINQLTAQAASLNQDVIQQKASGQSTGTLGDQLNQVELQLAGLTNISVVHGDQGDSISTGDGTPLVLDSQSFALKTTTGSNGHLQVIDADGSNITANISGGDLGGTIAVRDTQIPALQNSLDTLANQFATSFNAAQTHGFDQNGSTGVALFTIPSTVTGSAAGIALATSDPTAIAASSVSGSAASGSNGNLSNLTGIQNAALSSGGTLTTLSSDIVYQVGSLTSNAATQSSSIALSLTSLNDQQGAVSGVSVDEESANLVRFQQAYEAAAKVITTIQSLFDTTINMIS